MKTFTLYGTAFVLIATILIFLATQSGPDVPLDDISDGYRYSKDPDPPKSQTSHASLPPTKSPNGWTFNHKQDARNYGLSEEQCNIAFPELFKEVDRAVQYRKDTWGPITPDENDVEWRGDGIVKAMIHDNQLYIINPLEVWDGNHRPRTLATLHSLHRAITSYQGKLPDIEFSFTVQDFAMDDKDGNYTTWTYTRLPHQKKLWLMPDFGMWGWPDVGLRSYPEFQAVIEHEEDEFVDKVPKVVWRGSTAVGSKDVRQGLVDHSKGYKWSDVKVLDWSNSTNIEERLLSMQDHCSYMFMAQTEGNSYSGRLKFLLNCHSVLFSHDLEWLELYHHLLKSDGPDQNYVRVKRDYSDLPKKMSYYTKPSNIAKAQQIADKSRETFRERYLTPAAEACYWRALIRGWASVMGFTPEFWVEVKKFDKVHQKERIKRVPRGAPYEAYAIMEEVDWDIPAKPRLLKVGYDLEEEKERRKKEKQAKEQALAAGG